MARGYEPGKDVYFAKWISRASELFTIQRADYMNLQENTQI